MHVEGLYCSALLVTFVFIPYASSSSYIFEALFCAAPSSFPLSRPVSFFLGCVCVWDPRRIFNFRKTPRARAMPAVAEAAEILGVEAEELLKVVFVGRRVVSVLQ